MSANRTPLLGELCGLLTLRPIARRHRCVEPVRWSHLSTVVCHLFRLSFTTSFFICLLRSLCVSSEGLSQRFRSPSSASDLADAGRVVWKNRMRPTGVKKPLTQFTALLEVFSACSMVLVLPASARYSSQASAQRAQSAFVKLM